MIKLHDFKNSFALKVILLFLTTRILAYFLHYYVNIDFSNTLFSNHYESAGINLLNGNGFTCLYEGKLVPLSLYPPGYSLIIACIYFIFGINPVFINIFQGLFSLVTLLFFYNATNSLYGESLAKKSTLFLVLCPIFWTNAIDINTGSAFAINLTIIASSFLISAIRYDKVKFYIYAGLFSSCAITVRSEFAVFPVAFFIIFATRKMINYKIILFVISVIIVLLPLSIRNYRNFDHLGPLPGGLGLSMVNVIGKYYPDNNKGFAFGDVNILNVEKGNYNHLSYPFPYEREKDRLKRSLRFINENPGKYSIVMLKNIPIAWFGLRLEFFPQYFQDGLQTYLYEHGNIFTYIKEDFWGFVDRFIGFVISILLFIGMLIFILKTKWRYLKESYILIPIFITFCMFLPIASLGRYILIAYYFIIPIAIIGYSKLLSDPKGCIDH